MGFQFILLGAIVLIALSVFVILASSYFSQYFLRMKESIKRTVNGRIEQRRRNNEVMRFRSQYGD